MITELYTKHRTTIIQFIRFCIVGGSGMIVDMGITALSTEVFSLDPRIGAFFGFSVAVTTNYMLNRLWTFSQQKKSSHAFSFTSFLIISSVGMFISIGVMHLAMEYFHLSTGYWYLLARFIGIVVATMWNFAGAKFIAFK